MLEIHKILVPTDFSEDARRALDHAADLARVHGASLILHHSCELPVAVSTPWAYEIPPQLHDQVRQEASRRLEALREELGAAGLEATTSLGAGPASIDIVDSAGAAGADLIVMGTRGNTGIKHVLLGSVAERVIRHAACPVLTVKA